MTTYLVNHRHVDLDSTNFVGQGGQGSVYAIGATAYKLYTNPADMIPGAKIQELARLTDPRLIRPKDLIEEKPGKVVGYTMDFIADALVLTQLFPKAFKQRRQLDPATIFKLVEQLREMVDHTHQAGCLVVDLNEMNVLVSSDFKTPYLIDVDSFKTPSFPPTAIMMTIADPQVKRPTDYHQGSDWFAFAVSTFNLQIGIHPFEGRHAKLHTLAERMRAGISILNKKEVSYPEAATMPLDTIPPPYLKWYEDVFEHGVRTAPPTTAFKRSAKLVAVLIPMSKLFNITVLESLPDEIQTLFCGDGPWAALTADTVYVNGKRVCALRNQVVIGFGGSQRPVAARISEGKLSILDLSTRRKVPIDLRASEVQSVDGILYVRSEGAILTVTLVDSHAGLLAGVREEARVHRHATRLFPSCAIQSLLGSTYAVLLPKPGHSHQVRLVELDEYQILDAKYERNVLMLIGHHRTAKTYTRFVYRFEADFNTHDSRKVENVPYVGLNFVVSDGGVCVAVDEQDRLEVFSSTPSSKSIDVLDEPGMKGRKTLFRRNGQIVFVRDKTVYSLSRQ